MTNGTNKENNGQLPLQDDVEKGEQKEEKRKRKPKKVFTPEPAKKRNTKDNKVKQVSIIILCIITLYKY